MSIPPHIPASIIKAQELVDLGCKGVDHLNQSPELQSRLSPRQKISLTYYNHTKIAVSREESDLVRERIAKILATEDMQYRAQAEKYTHIPHLYKSYLSKAGDWEVHSVGPHRRNFPLSERIDILLFSPHFNSIPTPAPIPPTESSTLPASSGRAGRKDLLFYDYWELRSRMLVSPLLSSVIPALRRHSLAIDSLRESACRYLGIIRMGMGSDAVYRQLDVVLAPWGSRGTALLAMTGDRTFWQHLQNQARKCGLMLNEYGLWEWKTQIPVEVPMKMRCGRPPKRVVRPTGQWVMVRPKDGSDFLTEEAVMEHLGMEYVPPERRNFSFIVHKELKRKIANEYRPVVTRGRGRMSKEALEQDKILFGLK